MKGLWCDAVQLQITSISCTFDPNYDQQAQHDDTNGSQSQKHRSFSSILSNTRFTMGVRGSFGGVPLVEKRCSRSLCQSDIVGLWKSCRPSARYKTTDSHACSGFGEPRTRTKKRSKSKCFVSCRGGARDPSRSRLSLYRVVPNLSWPELLISLNISLLAQQASKRSSVLASRRCEGGESRFTAFALVLSLS